MVIAGALGKLVHIFLTLFPWVVYGGLCWHSFPRMGDFINILLQLGLIDNSITFMSNPDYFYAIGAVSSAIKGTG